MIASIFIKSFSRDFPRLDYAIRSIHKFASGFSEVIIAIPEGESYSAPSCHVIQIRGETAGNGYLFQQCVKANVHDLTDADFVLHIDSDTILTKPVTPETFMRDGKPLWLMTPYAHLEAGIAELSRANAGFHCGVMTWKAITEKFLGQPVEFEFMRRFPMLIPRSLHVAAAGFCQVWHHQSLAEYILSQPAKEFSEFNALGALAYYRARDDFSWLDTTKEPLPELVALQKWSHDPFTDETKAEFEEILKGGETNGSKEEKANEKKEDADAGDALLAAEAAPTGQESAAIRQTKEGIWVLVNDTHISRWVEERGQLQHDFQTLPKVLEEIQPGDTVIDVGAFIGDTAKPFLDRVGPMGHVYCFEPNPLAYECLMRNFKDVSNVSIDMNPLSDVEKDVALLTEENAGASFITEHSEVTNVRSVTLDNFFWPPIRRLEFIKIDVEGYELNVLRGAEQTINRFHPKLLVEINEGALQRQGASAEEISVWLLKHRYTWAPVQSDVTANSPQYDILCKWIGPALEDESSAPETAAVSVPWASALESITEVRSLASRLKKFCTGGAHTRKVRQELHEAGIIQLPYRFGKRKGWKRKAKA